MSSKFTLIFLLFNSLLLMAQPRLELTPDNIEFEDAFHRNKNVLFINSGDSPLRIDSLVYKNYYYFVRFNKPWEYPVFLQPNDTLKMDCILESYVSISSADTSDTLFIYNDGAKPLEKLKVKIKYYDDDYKRGYLTGQVTDDGTPVDSASVYFFYNYNYLVKSVLTGQDGFYNANLPPGQYSIAVEKDSYYVSFYENQFDPFNADVISLQKDSTKTINFQLDKMQNTGNSLSGFISDYLTNARLKRGVLVTRTGNHTPSKISAGLNNKILQNGIYTTFIKPDGSYNVQNIIAPGHYYVQAFSDYFVPSYYNFTNKSAIFWQQADSIFVNGSLSNVNIVLSRDSSVGGGSINGTVTVNSEPANLTDVMILAKSTDYNLWYNYGFLKDSGQFNITNLPYGNYQLLAQKIGFNDGTSTELQINSQNTVINGVVIPILVSSIGDEDFLPKEIQLYQNYPNPFNPTTILSWSVPEGGWQTLRVFDVLGRKIITLVDEYKPAGSYHVEFDARKLPSGIYFYELQVNNFIKTQKMIFMK